MTNDVIDDNTPDSVGALTLEEQQALPFFELIDVPFDEAKPIIKRHSINAKVAKASEIFFDMINQLVEEGATLKVEINQASVDGDKPGTISLARVIIVETNHGDRLGLFLVLSDDSKVIIRSFIVSHEDLEKSRLSNNLAN